MQQEQLRAFFDQLDGNVATGGCTVLFDCTLNRQHYYTSDYLKITEFYASTE